MADHQAEQTELKDWTPLSLTEGLLKHQLSIENRSQNEDHGGAITLISTTIGNMIKALITSEASHEDMEVVTITVNYIVLSQILSDPRLPYCFL